MNKPFIFILRKAEDINGISNLFYILFSIVFFVTNVQLYRNQQYVKPNYFISQKVTEKYINQHKGTHYTLKFHKNKEFKFIDIDSSEYKHVKIGDTIKFEIKVGNLGYDLYKSYYIP